MRYLMMAVALSAGSVQAAEVDVLTAEARQQTQALGQSLMKTLKQGIKSSGPVEAIGLCNVQAPAIASQLSQGGWQVGRTALKIRNPGNAPDEWETETLKSFDARIKAGESPQMMEATLLSDNEFRYMKAIPTKPLCVTCHGAELTEPVKARLSELYPDDAATGFNVGELRGAFTLTKTLQ